MSDTWLTVHVQIQSESTIEHEIQVSALEYQDWLDDRGLEASDEAMARFLSHDEDWHDRFTSATKYDEELWVYEIRDAEVQR